MRLEQGPFSMSRPVGSLAVRACVCVTILTTLVCAGRGAVGDVMNRETEPPRVSPGDLGGLREGDPIDIIFYCVNMYGGDPRGAVEKFLHDKLTGIEDEDANNFETIYRRNMFDYPVLYASAGDLCKDERVPKVWFETLVQSHAAIRETLRSVGRVEFYDGPLDSPPDDRFIIGTGFVVGSDILMTNRHVAAELGKAKSGGRSLPARINFGRTYDAVEAASFRIEGVLYSAPKDAPDVALLKVSAPEAKRLPPPVRLLRQQPTTLLKQLRGRKVAVCGYPYSDNLDEGREKGDSRKGLYLKMLKMLGVKRVSLGELNAPEHKGGEQKLYYNCTTLGGNSGSPVLDLQTGVVWGLHYSGGDATGNPGNVAYQMSVISQIPGVREHLEHESLENQIESALVGPVYKRPSLLVCRNGLLKTRLVSDEWSAEVDGHGKSVRGAIGSTCSVFISGPDGNRGAVGTGFVVSENSVLTSGIVARRFADRDGKLLTVRDNAPLEVTVDFARTICGDDSLSFKVIGVTHVDDVARKAVRVNPELEDRSRLALLKVEVPKGGPFPAPLRLRGKPPQGGLGGCKVFVVGYPALDEKIDPALFTQVFAWPQYNIKRLSPGILMPATPTRAPRLATDLFLAHDCSTAAGNAGSPLVDFETGDVLGVQVFSRQGVNYCVTSWQVLEAMKTAIAEKP